MTTEKNTNKHHVLKVRQVVKVRWYIFFYRDREGFFFDRFWSEPWIDNSIAIGVYFGVVFIVKTGYIEQVKKILKEVIDERS